MRKEIPIELTIKILNFLENPDIENIYNTSIFCRSIIINNIKCDLCLNKYDFKSFNNCYHCFKLICKKCQSKCCNCEDIYCDECLITEECDQCCDYFDTDDDEE